MTGRTIKKWVGVLGILAFGVAGSGCCCKAKGETETSVPQGLPPKRVVLIVPSVGCGACRLAIRKVLGTVPGIRSFTFSEGNRIHLELDPGPKILALTLDRLSKAGYSAKVDSQESHKGGP